MKILAWLTVALNVLLIGMGLWKHDWQMVMGSFSVAFWAGLYATRYDA